jgi:dihydroxyacid dehydratase/phosphogluconate dehydratase
MASICLLKFFPIPSASCKGNVQNGTLLVSVSDKTMPTGILASDVRGNLCAGGAVVSSVPITQSISNTAALRLYRAISTCHDCGKASNGLEKAFAKIPFETARQAAEPL